MSHLSEGEAELVVQLSQAMLGVRHGAESDESAAAQGEFSQRQSQLRDALHAVAEADGTVSSEELEEIDRIFAELGVGRNTEN